MESPEKFKDTLYLTGLRAYAAFGVFLVHFGLPYDFKSESIYNITSFGRNGVVLFFLLSAFTLALSIERSKKFVFLKYIKKRYMRIAPMLYIVSIYGFLFATSPWRYPHYPRFDILNLFSHFTFLNLGEINFDYQNSLIGVEWTLPIEFFFYLLLPYFYFKSRKKIFLFFLLIVSLFLHLTPELYNIYKSPHNVVGFDWSIQKYFFVFVLGLGLFRVITETNFFGYYPWNAHKFFVTLSGVCIIFALILAKVSSPEQHFFVLLFGLFLYTFYALPLFKRTKSLDLIKNISYNGGVVLLLCLTLLYAAGNHPNQTLFIAIAGVIIIKLCSLQSFMCKFLFQNKFILLLGTISYSFYLLQFPIHDILLKKLHLGENITFFWIIFFSTNTIVSIFTYKYIEKRFISDPKRKVTKTV